MQSIKFEFYQSENQIMRDAYNALAASLYLNTGETPPKTICITGCGEVTGKTTTALNLAISLSLAGWKTVLIDADFRRETYEKMLLSDLSDGFSEYVCDEANYEKILAETNYENLVYLPVGRAQERNYIRMLYSQRFQELLARLGMEYDFVIFDTFSLEFGPYAAIIASKCDATYVVTEINKTKKSKLAEELKKLNASDVNIMGIVLNRVCENKYKGYLSPYKNIIKKIKRKEEPKEKLKEKESEAVH